MRKSSLSKEALLYLITLSATVLIWYIVLEIWRADWHIPFDYGTDLGTDVLGASTMLKHYVQNGFSWKLTDVSIPFYFNRKAEFGVDRIILVLEIICSSLFSSYGACLNTLYLLSFIMISLTTVYCMRCLNFSRTISFAAAIIYTFLQYHMMRGEIHLYLSFYYTGPIAVLIMLWLVDESLLTPRFSRKVVGKIRYAHIMFGIFSWIIGLQQTYYSFFAAIGIVFAVLYRLYHRQLKKVIEGIVYLAIIAATTLIINLEAIFCSSDASSAYMRSQRTVKSIEAFSLKIINLLLPVQNHRLSWLSELRQHYDELVQSGNSEETWISLGFILSVCFCAALVSFLAGGHGDRKIRICGGFILAFLLVSTIGGGGSIIGLIFPLLRCYNRMCIYIAMFCTIVFAVSAERILILFTQKKVPRPVCCGLLVITVIFAVWDQTTPQNIYAYESTKEEYQKDEEFIHKIEDIMPEGASIFELPILPMGTTSLHNLKDYELYKPYLHARTTKWLHMYSVGGQTDQWVNILYGLPLQTAINVIVCCGFQGVYLDSRGYTAEEWKDVLAVLNSFPETAVIWSEDGQKAFYDLTGYATVLAEKLGAETERYADSWLSLSPAAVYPASSLFYTIPVTTYGNQVILPPGCRQYGPYTTLPQGEYFLYVLGENLENTTCDVTYANGEEQIDVNILWKSDCIAVYSFDNITERTNVELRNLNNSTEDAAISAVLLFDTNQSDQLSVIAEFMSIQQ